jgi:hypothetical protein
MMIVARVAVSVRSACLMLCSVAVSIAAVESSKIRIGGPSRMLRAIDRRCRWPPEAEPR